MSPCNYFPVSFITANLTVSATSRPLTTGTPAINPFSPSFYNSAVALTTNLLCSSTVGIPTLTSATSFDVYPNPSNGILITRFTAVQSGQAKIEISNMLGENVWNHLFPVRAGENELDIRTKPEMKGMYVLTINYQEKLIRKKIFIR